LPAEAELRRSVENGVKHAQGVLCSGKLNRDA
jgi:hypothetical protein